MVRVPKSPTGLTFALFSRDRNLVSIFLTDDVESLKNFNDNHEKFLENPHDFYCSLYKPMTLRIWSQFASCRVGE